MPKDYYLVLGVRPNSTLAEIKSAYRHRALQLHPDRTGADPGPFQEIQEAYAILSDPMARKTYDHTRQPINNPVRSSSRGVAEPLRSISKRPTRNAHPSSPTPLMDQVAELRHRPMPPQRTAPNDPALLFNVRLNRHQAQSGGQMRLQIPLEVPCPACHGRGGYAHHRCGHCGGAGLVTIESGVTVTYPPWILSTHLVRVAVPLPGNGSTHILVRFHVV